MTPTIREKVLHCSRLFKSVSVESGELKDVSQHFVNWYSNIAAHRAGPASLDERLRDAPDVRAAILRFLDILIKMFDDYKFENTSGDINNSSKNHTPLDMLVYNAASSKPITLMYKVIDCLKRITVAIRAPASVDRYKKARNFDIDYYRPIDRSHIMELFPAADPILQDRLLEAVLSRRRFLRYTQDHRKKLGHKSSIQNGQNVGERIDAEENSEFADTVATPITPGTALEDYSPMELCGDDRSVYSNSSSLRSDMMARVPSMPLEGQSGKPFECPCCFLMMEVKNREQWKRHVTSDMRPYVCTFTGCKVPDTLFPSRHGWYSHEIAFHRRKWFCVSGCSLQFDSRELFDSHVKASHRELLKTADAETHGAYSRQLPEHQATSCPLCHEELQNSKLAERHIGRHLLQLGMWPLRSMREFEDDDNQQECEEADSEVDDSEEVDKEEEMRDDEEMEKEKADNTTAADKHLQMKQSGEIKSRREADNEVQEALRSEFLERLKIIGREEQKQFALESTVDIPMSPEEYAETAEKLKRIVVDMGKVGRGLVKWYSITQDDARAKMFFRLRLRVIKQHVDGDEMKVVKDVFSIRSSELDQARAMLESMAKDLAANFALSRQQTQQAQQKNLTQPAPLMTIIPKMI